MLLLRFAAIPLTAVIVAFGVWVAGGWITDDFRVSMALTAGWFVVAALGCLLVARRVRLLRVPVVLGYVIAAGVIGAYLGATTLRGLGVSPPAGTRFDREIRWTTRGSRRRLGQCGI